MKDDFMLFLAFFQRQMVSHILTPFLATMVMYKNQIIRWLQLIFDLRNFSDKLKSCESFKIILERTIDYNYSDFRETLDLGVKMVLTQVSSKSRLNYILSSRK